MRRTASASVAAPVAAPVVTLVISIAAVTSAILATFGTVACTANPHPAGYATPTDHGWDFALQDSDCRDCHGDDLTGEAGVTGCDSCHAPPDVSASGALALSGEQREHVAYNLACSECHPNVDEDGDITEPATHVDGQATVQMPDGMTSTGQRCTGTCHEENHDGDDW